MSGKRRVQNSRKIFALVTTAFVARNFLEDSAIRYVLPALWMTSFAHNGAGKGDMNRAHIQTDSPGSSTGSVRPVAVVSIALSRNR